MYRTNKKSISSAWIIILHLILYWLIVPHTSLLLIGIVIILEDILMVARFRYNHILLIISAFLLWSNYSILAMNVFWPVDEYFTGYRKDLLFNDSIYILFLFNSLLYSFTSRWRIRIAQPLIDDANNHNSLIVCGSMILLVLILIFGMSRPDTIGERADPSPLYEYSVIIFILAYTYTKNKIQRFYLTILLFAFALQNLVFGGRITALQLFLVFFLVYIKPDVNILKYSPIGFVLLIVFSIIGNFRAEALVTNGGDMLQTTLDGLTEGKLTLDTAYYAFHASMTFIKVEYILPFTMKIYMFFQFVLSIFLGGTVKDSNLAMFTIDYFDHQFGGIYPYFGYFYLGVLGVVILCMYLVFILKKINYCQSNYIKCLGVVVCCCVPRWYLYSPNAILRSLLIYSICYYLCYKFNSMTKKRKIKYNEDSTSN